MKQFIYECPNCSHEQVSRNRDGMRCDACLNLTTPIREATEAEVTKSIYDRALIKEQQRAQIAATKYQMEYLDRLIRIHETVMSPSQKAEVFDRITIVCDSIEADLGLAMVDEDE